MIKDKKPYRILVIEDNPGDYFIVEDFLLEQILNPSIVHVNNFKEAAATLISDASFDVILLDLTLPDKSSENLIAEIISLATQSPVIILTGYTDIDFSIKSISMGILDYLLKDELNAVMLYKSILYAIERKKAVAELKASEKRYSDLFHLSPQPMCLYEKDTYRFTKINNAATVHYGYTEEEFMQMNILDIIPVEDRQKAVEKVKSQNRILNETYQAKSRSLKKSGEIIDVETFSTPIITNNKENTLLIAIDVTEKNQHEQAIIKAIIKTQEDERYEIGGELHDNVCQILATSLLSLGMLKRSLPATELRWYDDCNKYIRMASDEIRNLSHRLAPAFLDGSTLENAFDALLNSFNMEERYKVLLEFDEAVNEDTISHELQLNLYRILQEQLKNILKYANASSIKVAVNLVNNKISMTVEDDGVGFDTAAVKSGIGISNMRRRVELFFGQFELFSSPGNGCTITISIPLSSHQ